MFQLLGSLGKPEKMSSPRSDGSKMRKITFRPERPLMIESVWRFAPERWPKNKKNKASLPSDGSFYCCFFVSPRAKPRNETGEYFEIKRNKIEKSCSQKK